MSALRGRFLLVALLVVVPVLAVLLTATRGTTRPLDPASPAPDGTRALARVLAGQGVSVERVERLARARSALRADGGRSTLVVTDVDLLPPGRLGALARQAARTVVLAPDDAATQALAPRLQLGTRVRAERTAAAGCADADARAAGRADAGGRRITPLGGRDESTLVCFDGSYARVQAGRRSTVVFAQTGGLTNADLASDGNAALALRALGSQPHVVWLMASALDSGAGSRRSVVSLAPRWVLPLVAQLLLVGLAVVLLRGRRLGPVVTEPLPVVVRAAETVHGRAALYRAADSPAASAAALRGAARARLAARSGLPPGTPTTVLLDRLAALAALGGLGLAGPDAARALTGPEPRTGAELLALARDLDALETAVAARGSGPPAAGASAPPSRTRSSP